MLHQTIFIWLLIAFLLISWSFYLWNYPYNSGGSIAFLVLQVRDHNPKNAGNYSIIPSNESLRIYTSLEQKTLEPKWGDFTNVLHEGLILAAKAAQRPHCRMIFLRLSKYYLTIKYVINPSTPLQTYSALFWLRVLDHIPFCFTAVLHKGSSWDLPGTLRVQFNLFHFCVILLQVPMLRTYWGMFFSLRGLKDRFIIFEVCLKTIVRRPYERAVIIPPVQPLKDPSL